MKVKCRIFVALMYTVFSFSMLLAQKEEFVFEHISNNMYMAYSSVRNIYQDKTGFMWFGTTNGLILYDGQTFTRFRSSDNENSISHNAIKQILETRDTILWVATGNGLNKYNPKDGKFQRFMVEYSPSISNNVINGIVEDKHGNLWIITDSSISIYDSKTQQFKNYTQRENASYIPSRPTSITIDSDGNILVGYENLILDYIFVDDKDVISSNINYKRFYLNEDNPNGYYISCIYQSSEKKYWVGTSGLGFFSINYYDLQKALQSNDNKIKCNYYNSHFYSYNKPFPEIITDICEDKNSNIYLTSFGDGLYCYNPKYDSFNTFTYSQETTTLNSNYLYSIHIDRSDNIWIGTYSRGINKHPTNKTSFELYQVTSSHTRLLKSDMASAIYEDREGILWVGSWEGITKIDRKTGSSKIFSPVKKNQVDALSNRVRSIVEDNRKRLWVGTSDGLHCFDKKSENFINYNSELQKLLIKNPIRDLLLQNNILWIASYNGLIKYNLSNNQFSQYQYQEDDPTSISHNAVWSLCLDKFNNLWVGTRNCINLFDQKNETFTPFLFNDDQPTSSSKDGDIITTITSDTSNTIWVGTYGRGVFCLTPIMGNDQKPDYSDSELKSISLPIDRGFITDGLLIDSKQNLWVGTDNEIIFLNKDKNNVRSFNLNDLAINNQLITGSYFRSGSDEIFFGGNNGMLSFFPEELKYNNNVPQTVITSININDSLYYSGTTAAYCDKILFQREGKSNHLAVSFAALEFTNPQLNRYKYMLEGYDTDWIEIQGQNTATYMNLNPGEYIFKVMGSNNNTIWSDNSANLKIVVKPTFWESDLFVVILLITVIMIIFLSTKINLRRIKKQKERLAFEVQNKTSQLTNTNKLLEQEIIERKQIEQDIIKTNELLSESNAVKDKLFSIISHDLKGSFSGFTEMLKLLVKELDDISESHLREMLESMDESAESTYNILETLLLWATHQQGEIENNAEEYDISLLIKSVGNNLKHIAKSKNITLNLDIEEGYIAKFDKNSINVVIRNLTTNALKFTHQNGNVWYTVEKQNSYIIVSVNDDGIGISKENRDKILNNNKRETSLGTKGEKGTGIGLILCKDFVKKNGGTLWIESELGKGSSFKFSLPIGT